MRRCTLVAIISLLTFVVHSASPPDFTAPFSVKPRLTSQRSIELTVTGTNLYRFAVHRSSDLKTWQSISQIVAATNARTFKMELSTPANSVEFFRLIRDTTTLGHSMIIRSPTNQTAQVGGTATFQVDVWPSATTYIWYFNGKEIQRGSLNSLTVRDAATGNAGQYQVFAQNAVGGSWSDPAILAITGTQPTVVTQPQSRVVTEGQPLQLTVSVTGSAPLAYQWRLNQLPIPRATNQSYSVTSAKSTDGGDYDVVVSNNFGSVTSARAIVTIVVPPKIAVQPNNFNVTEGQPFQFSVSATGTAPLSYQWRLNNRPIAGATSASYLSPSAKLTDAGTYTVLVSNPAGTVTSSSATLSVSPKPAELAPPSIRGRVVTFAIARGDGFEFSDIGSYKIATAVGESTYLIVSENFIAPSSGNFVYSKSSANTATVTFIDIFVGRANGTLSFTTPSTGSFSLRSSTGGFQEGTFSFDSASDISGAFAPVSFAGKSALIGVLDGDDPFADEGTYRFATAATTYQLRFLDIAGGSSGTYRYTKTGNASATIQITDSLVGAATATIEFISPRAGIIRVIGARGGFQLGNFLIE
ncbi:MAG: hypothetical protein FJ403_22995 [Verrucomicrobia bacterium]|nr:hypothetical protein [Verrucomicrobiota bacterium]